MSVTQHTQRKFHTFGIIHHITIYQKYNIFFVVFRMRGLTLKFCLCHFDTFYNLIWEKKVEAYLFLLKLTVAFKILRYLNILAPTPLPCLIWPALKENVRTSFSNHIFSLNVACPRDIGLLCLHAWNHKRARTPFISKVLYMIGSWIFQCVQSTFCCWL